MSDETQPAVSIQIICAICGRADPHVAAGCDSAGCTWRAEAVAEALAAGGELHTEIVDADHASRQSTVRITVWPKTKGNA